MKLRNIRLIYFLKKHGVAIEWRMAEGAEEIHEGANDWVLTDSVAFNNHQQHEDSFENSRVEFRAKRFEFLIMLTDLRSFKCWHQHSDNDAVSFETRTLLIFFSPKTDFYSLKPGFSVEKKVSKV